MSRIRKPIIIGYEMTNGLYHGTVGITRYRGNNSRFRKAVLKQVSVRLRNEKYSTPDEELLWRLSDVFFNIEEFIIEEYRESAK